MERAGLSKVCNEIFDFFCRRCSQGVRPSYYRKPSNVALSNLINPALDHNAFPAPVLTCTGGSVRFLFGSNPGSELPSQATFKVCVRSLSNLPDTEAKALASIITSALSPSLILSRNPRTLFQLVVQALSPLRVRGHVSGMVAAVIIDQRRDTGVFECTDGGNHMFCGCWKKGGSGNGRGSVGGRGGGGHRMFGVPCYAALGPPGDDRVMRAHALEGRGPRVEWDG